MVVVPDKDLVDNDFLELDSDEEEIGHCLYKDPLPHTPPPVSRPFLLLRLLPSSSLNLFLLP